MHFFFVALQPMKQNDSKRPFVIIFIVYTQLLIIINKFSASTQSMTSVENDQLIHLTIHKRCRKVAYCLHPFDLDCDLHPIPVIYQ